MKSTMALAKARCDANHWPSANAEKFVATGKSGGGFKVDLFGFIDLVVLQGELGILGVQVTVRNAVGARIRKIQEERADNARAWLASGGRIEVWGCQVTKPVGSRKLITEWRIVQITGKDLKGYITGSPQPKPRRRKSRQLKIGLERMGDLFGIEIDD